MPKQLTFLNQEELLRDQKFTDPKSLIDFALPQLKPERLEKILRVIRNRIYHVHFGFEDIYDEGNQFAALRSFEGLGFFSAHFINNRNHLKKSSGRTDSGSTKWIHLNQWDSTTTFITSLKEKGFKVYGTHLSRSRPLAEIDFSEPSVVIMGNEHRGLSPEAESLCDGLVHIPMYGFVESFNISVATALILNFIRGQVSHETQPLSEAELDLVKTLYLTRSLESLKK